MAANCEKCGGPIWDNTFSKRNPKQPDLKCKNQEECGWVKWLTDVEKNAQRATNGGAPSSNGTKPAGGLILDAIMYRCHESAIAICNKLYGSDFSSEAVVACAHSLFIARCRGEGILKMEKPTSQPAAPPPPPPPAPEPEYVDAGADDLPF